MPSLPTARRIIMVPKSHEVHLKVAVGLALGAVVGEALRHAGADLYEYIKDHLARKGIVYDDRLMDPSRVPAGKAYYHS